VPGAQALSGALSINGEAGSPGVKIGIPLGDMVGGIFVSISVLSAVYERSITKRGRLIDVSLHDGLIGMLGYMAQLALINGKDPAPVGSAHPNLVPYGTFPAKDGSILIACLTNVFWIKLCEAIGQPDLAYDPRFVSLEDRRANRVEVNSAISHITLTKTVEEWTGILTEFDVPNAPILGIVAALNHPHARAREMVVETQHPTAGKLELVGRAVKFPESQQRPITPPPLYGQHTSSVLEELLELSQTQIQKLVDDGIVHVSDAVRI
jgi:crotonobetainyl-CoA:carnitine CoA-transferase CaiB-like acyl-CoA transferase